MHFPVSPSRGPGRIISISVLTLPPHPRFGGGLIVDTTAPDNVDPPEGYLLADGTDGFLLVN